MITSTLAYLDIAAATAFLGAFMLAGRNYVKTAGITTYWRQIALVAALGFGWTGLSAMQATNNVSNGMIWMPIFAVAAVVGYAASSVQVLKTEGVTEVI